MEPLKITASLATAIATYDDYSPSLDSLVEWLILDRLNLCSPNPTSEQVEATQAIVDERMPLQKAEIGGEWYWATSSPCYQIINEQQDRFRKRWQPGTDSPEPNWGKRRAKWSGSEGAEKSYDLPLYLRSTPAITWYCVGDLNAIFDLLSACSGIGKKRSYGSGQIIKWEVEPHEHDWHLWRDGALMRPIPITEMPTDRPIDIAILNWGWRPPAWLHTNKARCAMPVHCVRKPEI